MAGGIHLPAWGSVVRLELRTLGRTEARLDGEALPGLCHTKIGLLLVYLAVERPRRVPRLELAGRFWPDQAADAGRANLRQALFQLRRQLGGAAADLLQADARQVRLRPEAGVWVDGLRLEACVRPSAARQRLDPAQLLTELNAYQGHFLVDLGVSPEATGLEDWLTQNRQRFWRAALTLLEQCLEERPSPEDNERILRELQRFLDLEPFDEVLHRLMMRGLAAGRQPTRALDHFLAFEALLRRELDTRPGPTLRRLYSELRERLAPAAQASVEDVRLRPERRRVALVVCDLRPPPRTAGQTDVETLTAAVQQGVTRVESALFEHRGHIVRLPWACLLGYFGYPSGREEATLDALRAAWEALQSGPAGVRPRIAVDSDVIITGSEPEVPDPAGLLTARALSLAERTAPGTVAVSPGIRDRFQGRFRFAGGGTSAPRLVNNPGHADRVEARLARAAVPLIGRAEPLARLRRAWRQAADGRCTSLVIRSEAGLGKSRLARGLAEEVREEAALVLMLPCRQRLKRQLLMPLRQALAGWIGPRPDQRRARARRRLLQARLRPHLDHGAAARRLAAWLTDTGDRGLIRQGSDRDRVLDSLVQVLAGETRRGPVLIVCDDAHWIDSGTAELFRRIQRRLARHPVLLILTGRMSFRAEWLHTAPGELRLSGLSGPDSQRLIRALDGDGVLPEATRRAISARGEGVPLFLEELTLHALQRHRGGEPGAALPPGLSDLLVARLESLGPCRELAHAAAVIGREFDSRLLARLTGSNLDQVQTQVKRLMAQGFVERDGSRLRFRHALFHQAAYEALLATERRALHGRLAQLLEEDAALGLDAPDHEVLAEHLREAGRPEEAVEHWLMAGEHALALGMLPEAEQHCADALALLGRLTEAGGPPGRQRSDGQARKKGGPAEPTRPTQR
ncbi:transcriptional activator domain protein [Alkalilimnicola ehrlichii MLHE-1]|uniref:Transcriptional activator domain protein n=1 Tax=Alkalilimnicola ehrlichii (strain ATCC BAA-1101 / DSM 17681 / MLHE-1) TaxID=187272 RepID=Q0ACK2_ALKEH|nr:transcriptional activator domain protein [Alkalilimnicola ehrlichii MLHE-1]